MLKLDDFLKTQFDNKTANPKIELQRERIRLEFEKIQLKREQLQAKNPVKTSKKEKSTSIGGWIAVALSLLTLTLEILMLFAIE